MKAWMLLFLLAPAALADPQDAFDPSGYIKQMPVDAPQEPADKGNVKAVKQSEVSLGGKPYRRFESSTGAIYVPKVTHVTKEQLERSLCAPEVLKLKCDRSKVKNHDSDFNPPEECKDTGTEEAKIIRAEVPLSDDVVAYADLILAMIERKCGSAPVPNVVKGSSAVEVGIEAKNKGRDPGSKKIFIRPLAPEVGAGVSF